MTKILILRPIYFINFESIQLLNSPLALTKIADRKATTSKKFLLCSKYSFPGAGKSNKWFCGWDTSIDQKLQENAIKWTTPLRETTQLLIPCIFFLLGF